MLRLVSDKGAALYNRIDVQGYEECQSDILAVSEMAEDIRDALLQYQVGGEKVPHSYCVTEIGMVQQTIQQRATYDQNCRLIVSSRICVLRTYLTVTMSSRILVRRSFYLSPCNKLTRVLYSPPNGVEQLPPCSWCCISAW